MDHSMSARILVVDDDRSARRFMEAALKSRDYEVVLAKDGIEALERLRSDKFDLLISDLHMPHISGDMVVDIAHALQPDLGMIIVTGFKTPESIVRSFRRGLHAYLTKPIDLAQLYHVVDRALRARKLGQAAEIQLEQPGDGWLEFTAPSHHVFVDRFENLFRMLFDDGVASDVLDDLRMAILEMGGNAVEWGNRSDQSKPIHISVKRSDDQIVLIFKDEGEGFDLKGVPDPTKDPVGVLKARQLAGKRPGGYGLALVRKLVDGLVYNKQGNLVMITKRLKPEALDETRLKMRALDSSSSEDAPYTYNDPL